MTMKRVLAAMLALVMAFGLMTIGCTPTASADAEPRTITIGVWWDFYYDSTHESEESDPAYSGSLSDQMRFENVKYVEEKYNVRFEYVNMTYAGVKESINTSILAGTPDCDVYLCELAFGIPAAISGLAMDLKTVLPADADILSNQTVLSYLDLGDGKASLMKQVKAENAVEATYPLAFNVEMLEDNNLEDPRELYARGEWTWDKFIEYCQVLTQDTDGDGVTDQYGFDGFSKDVLGQLMLSNGASIASGTTETLSSAATGEVLQFYSDLYNTYNVAAPYEFGDSGDVMRFRYREGKVGFWPGAAWIASTNADYDWDGSVGSTLEFETAYVQWPVGPSGNQETNKGKFTAGSFWLIPNGVEDPEFVYEVFEAVSNWYHDDVSIRDDKETMWWWYAVTAGDEDLQEENFQVMFDMGTREQFDLWDSVNVEMDLESLIRGDMTAAQMQETYRQEYQAGLDAYFG